METIGQQEQFTRAGLRPGSSTGEWSNLGQLMKSRYPGAAPGVLPQALFSVGDAAPSPGDFPQAVPF